MTFGPVTLKFRFVAEEVGQATATMMHGAVAKVETPIVKIPMESGDKLWDLLLAVSVIGTQDGVDIQLRDSFVSRRHVQLVPSELGVRVEDLDSRNGVFVGSQRIRNAEMQPPFQLKVGDTVVHVLPADDGDAIPSVPALIGNSPAMSQLKSLVTRVAAADIPT